MRILLVCAIFLSFTDVHAQMRITEYMYSGANGEFVEFTNTGSTPVDMTGWSFDDATRTPGTHSLAAVGVVMPGESVIATETAPAVFRAAWNLCAGIKIAGGYTNDNLGRADEINLYNASNVLEDRLTYDDQSLGGPRTQNKSAWVKAAGLGANTPAQWTLSAVGDAEGSFASTGGDIGSPGKSTRATVAFNPCVVVNGAPTITMNINSTTNLLDGGAVTPPASPYVISGVIGDPTDPAKFKGIDFIIGDDITAVDHLVVTVSSNNQSVAPDSSIMVTGSGASRNVRINPVGIGYANITISVSDSANTSNYVLVYAASAAAANPANTFWHTGISDASDAIALDSNYFVTGDDELDVLNVYNRAASGLPVTSYNYAAALNLPDPAKPEVDVEAATRSTLMPNRQYWLGSMSNGKSPFDNKPNRNRLFATNASGTGKDISLVGFYGNLRATLIAWGDANGYDFSSSAAAGVDSKTASGFAAEGMVFGPDSTTLYIGLRAPLVPTTTRKKAVIAPLLHFETFFNDGAPSGDPALGAPIELDLGGRGIRDLIRLPNGTYVILAGSPGETPLAGALYVWTGKAGDSAIFVNSPGVASLNIEGALPVMDTAGLSLSKLEVISDMGGDILYNDDVEAKSLGDNNLKKFRSDLITGIDLRLDTPPVVVITSPGPGAVLNAGPPITVTAYASVSRGTITKVAFFAGNLKVGEDTLAPYELTATDIEPGIYLVTARAYDNKGDSATTDTVRITVTGCTGSGYISGEGYTDIAGSKLVNLTSNSKYPNAPEIRAQLNSFEYGPNIGDNYGARIRGYICAPVTGNYTFYLASSNESELWLSTDDNPIHIKKIAFVTGAVGFRSWYDNLNQRSTPVHLVKGVRYFIGTIHKAGTGTDHLSVGWILPGGAFEAPIGGNRLSPYDTASQSPVPAQDFATAMRTASESATTNPSSGQNDKELKVTVSPNPSAAQFTLTIHSGSDAPVTLKIADITGRRVEARTGLSPNGTIQVGGDYPAGVYIAELNQNNRKVRVKLLKR